MVDVGSRLPHMHGAPPSTRAGLSAGVVPWIMVLAPGARFDWRRDRGGMAIMHIEAPNRRLEVVATQAISHFEIQGCRQVQIQ
jgi:hypothetical protein